MDDQVEVVLADGTVVDGLRRLRKNNTGLDLAQLSAGTFTINGGNFLLLDKGITLRGAGPGQTTLQKTDGAQPGQEAA